MLSTQQKEIIKSTAPILEEKGTEITSRFYEMLFQNHPELLNIFNQTNQKKGRQPTALANSIVAAAYNIDQLENILPVVKQIAHKHRSLGVQPEHYPIVGEHLLLAIQDVLGEAATDDILNAWKDAYQVIADVFIEVEDNMYKEAENQIGGWSGYKPFFVDQKVQESDEITSFYLKPVDESPLPVFQPGQYIGVELTIPGDTYRHIRQYSLSDAPNKPYYRISVKRDGKGSVSNYLHDYIKEGDTFPVSAPAGDFVLDLNKNTPIVLLSGGVGLTPLTSMLNTVVKNQPEREIIFIQAARNGNVHGLKEEIVQLSNNNENVTSHIVYSEPTEADRKDGNYDKEGIISFEWLQEVLPHNEMDFYFCGPEPFMDTVYNALYQLGVSEEQIHFEFFGPAKQLEIKQNVSV
ncbi:NO-inducible flavohemoprotein [Pontibacillus marinus]|uniref:Flavohemoprotein n=1 Tax=Pontibacillus marinus BH030004 = DSM 16465 TaxID=1385511 RepID=A0A0A5GJS3_9BACI|nr:NO-inducible flavohemoprotein [Pontibacillus marinus]KGX91458.1 dihydropteridine reductase [Pontibacillus marinus BH030004 = DSM 16465]